jgi:ubiquinone/menaquinone biosynthesis C-methylase UbiE
MFASTDPARADRLPVLYDVAQILFGGRRSRSRVAATLAALAPSNVLDVGGGTGFYAPAVPAHAHYVVADLDVAKIRRLRERRPRADAIVADATALPVRSDAVDVALFIAVAHHLPDEALDRALGELARVARRHVLFIDPLATKRMTGRALWQLDRGSSPRTPEELTGRAELWFELEHVEVYSILHDYLLWVGSPRPSDIR